MKTIVIVADSVNRRYLSTYGNDWVKTPNLDRLGQESVVFENHWTGSAPCMPARRDMLTGRLNFLERNWGPIEPFDYTLPQALRKNEIYTHMVTDHYHYLETGGENYCQAFDTWECFRGQESDAWVSRVNKNQPPNHNGKYSQQYELNKTRFQKEEDYPSPVTLKAAADWVEKNREADNYMLWVECFDPHEPFDLPEECRKVYPDNYDGPLYNWPEYGPVNVSEEAVRHVQNRYAALLTMTDKWLGELFAVMDKNQLWDDTLVIFTTDHGYMLGEHGLMAKNYMAAYNEVFNIPLFVRMPGGKNAGKRCSALTQNIDLFPTIMDAFGINIDQCPNKLHGHSWLPLINGEQEKIREYAIYGNYGRSVNITDGKHTYFRAPVSDTNQPLNLYMAMPTTIFQFYGIEQLKNLRQIEMGRFLKWTDYPVYKIPAENIKLKDKNQAFNSRFELIKNNLLYNLKDDYQQERPIQDPVLEQQLIAALKQELKRHDAPDDQYLRLGL